MSGFGKQFIYPSRDSKGVYTFLIDELIDHKHLIKTAAEYHPQISNYIKSAKPIPGIVQVLITALGGVEMWGSNVNGDGFPKAGLAPVDPNYGHKTFEYYAKIRKHHLNKEHHPEYGTVALSVWNEAMQRVELILKVSEAADYDLANTLAQGRIVDWSMGAKLPYDECSICGHQSKKIDEYCEHLRFMMNKIDPVTGRQVYAINRYPKFFDISHVLIGADRTNATWLKVAQAHGMHMDHRHTPSAILFNNTFSKEAASKYAGLKTAEITKKVTPNISPALTQNILDASKKLQDSSPTMSKHLIIELSAKPLPSVFSTMTGLGIMPKPEEFQGIVLRSLGQGSLAEELERKNICFDPSEASEHKPLPMNMSPDLFSQAIAKMLLPLISQRSFSRPILVERITMIKKAAMPTRPGFEKSKAQNIPLLGTLAAMFATLSWKHLAGSSDGGLARIFHQNPILLSALGAGIIAGASIALDTPEQGTGYFDVANGPKPLYNNSNRLDLLQNMQQHPVMLVKAGSTQQAHILESRLFHGLPSLLMAGTVSADQAITPNLNSAFTKVASPEGVLAANQDTLKLANQAMTSSLRVLGKVASADDLSLYPDNLRTTIADLAVLSFMKNLV